MKTDGTYIVIEGVEGVGKTTVIERLARELQAQQVPVQVIADVGQPQDMTAQAIQRIIDDPRYPAVTRTEVLLSNAASSQAVETVHRMVAAGTICIADHSYLTTLVHEYYGQGDITNYEAARQLVEYAAGDPKPDLLILLDAPVATLKSRLSTESQSVFDEAYQERLRAGYLWEANQRRLPVIHTTDSADTVFAAVWQQVSVLLGTSSKREAVGAPSVAEVLAAKQPVQTSPVEPPTVLPAVQPVHDTPAGSTEQAASAAEKSSDTGGSTVTLTSVSELAAGRLVQHKGAARIRQTMPASSTKDANGRYQYYIPPNLTDELRVQYTRGMDQLFDTHAGLVTNLTKYLQAASTDNAGRTDAGSRARTAVRGLLPTAALTSVTITATPRAAEKLAARLQSDDLPEATALGQGLATTVGTTTSTSTFTAVQVVAEDLLPRNHTASTSNAVALAGYDPHNELDVAASIVYEHSDLPLADIQRAMNSAAYQRKTDVLRAYLGDQPAANYMNKSVLTGMQYSFDIISSHAVFRDLQILRPIRRATAQLLSPRLGYTIPALIEDANATDIFEHCFDVSLQLYSALQAGGSPAEAQYATLLGHNVRWSVMISAADILYLQQAVADSKQGLSEDARQLVQSLFTRIAEVHPVLTDAMHLQVPGDLTAETA